MSYPPCKREGELPGRGECSGGTCPGNMSRAKCPDPENRVALWQSAGLRSNNDPARLPPA